MLHRIRRRFAHPLGQLPAVLALTAAQQALQIRKAPRTGFRTRKQLRDQPMRPQQLTLPSRQTFLHPSCRRITLQSNPRLSFIYNCSTRRASSSQPNELSSSPTTSSWPQRSSLDGPSSSRGQTSSEKTYASTLPSAASWLLKSAYGLPHSCVDRRLNWSLADGLAEQENRVLQGQQWHDRCECAVP